MNVINLIIGILALIFFIGALIVGRWAVKRIDELLKLQEKIDKSLEEMKRIGEDI